MTDTTPPAALARARHGTHRFKRDFAASPERIFEAWRDVEARTRWAVPAGDGLVFDEHDFRVGGRDVSRCGPQGDLSYRVETRYCEIVPAARLVLAETVEREQSLLAVSLITVELSTRGARTELKLTAQIADLADGAMLRGADEGWGEVLENLRREVEAPGA